MMRAFVGIELPDTVADILADLQDRLPAGRLTDPEAFHLTLAFLDDQPDDTLEALHLALSEVALPPFSVQVRGLGTFGRRAPQALWAGVARNPSLAGLHGKVRGAAHRAGIVLRRERFRPHVTLARFGEPLLPEELEKLRRFLERFDGYPAPPFEVASFTLYRSILTKSGPVHEPLAEYPLQEAQQTGEPQP